MTGRRLLARGWPVFVPVVVLNATAQAALVAPFLTPGTSAGFIALAALSGAALVVALVLVVGRAVALAASPGGAVATPGARVPRPPYRVPPLRLWIAGLVTLAVLGASAIVFAPLVVIAATAVLLTLPSVAYGAGWSAGFRMFGARPFRTIIRCLLTVALLGLLWLIALALGFLITGVAGAALTWLVFGVAAVLLVCWWTAALAHAATVERKLFLRNPQEQ
ncbi:hypothetical protein B7R54_05995 [Subtercola boreus]|uniref:Integral membrane protein n=1 Tax=Subtercola boreus TaxID=120213 RepID=A0A3E0VFU6_9MICO|nr:hypothetical protein [Subtercola boreus]RFA08826.1 hypothetical protein B7R54_05995 [Subtercola boreus]TQL54205.1 hypothetical protein FB464_1735 [Subtercola boreus]